MAVAAVLIGNYNPEEENTIVFTSISSFAQILSENNMELLRVIDETHTCHLSELSKLTNRSLGNLSRTISTLERYGIVKSKRDGVRKIVEVVYDTFELTVRV